MAIDGVAPRAKINQQRSRRFRTAADAAEALRKAQSKGEVLPPTAAFDSNCITPGTVFMRDLSRYLEYFITKKLNEDDNWRGVKVVFSGQEVPGEGEHKILEYIRLSRSQSEYDPNTRHCIYGLDADLIMLGLLTHDPHFCLLREEVIFGRAGNTKAVSNPESIRFFLLHLSLFREYLDLDISPQLKIEGAMPFKYDPERVIDDFILMALFVGNDFLPNLPTMQIEHGALVTLFEIYKRILPELGGYINDNGRINFKRVEVLLSELSKIERVKFDEDNGSSAKPKQQKPMTGLPKILTQAQKQILKKLKPFVMSIESQDLKLPESAFLSRLTTDLGLYTRKKGGDLIISHHSAPRKDNIESESEDEESQLARARVLKKFDAIPVAETTDENDSGDDEFYEQKRVYYSSKLGIDINNKDQLSHLVGYYAQGLQWVMDYYYLGVQSWGWFYPYHYAPMMSDLVNLQDCIDLVGPMKSGAPFKPFEQLMGVLPARSIQLLPEAFHDLILGVGSPIRDFYPETFETDLNGKKNEWEAVVKIPFVDEKRLTAALKSREHRLTDEEKKRNSFGSTWQFVFSANATETQYISPSPSSFPSVMHNRVRMSEFHLPTLEGNSKFVHGLVEGVKLGTNALPGFPTLYTLNFEAYISRHGVRVFGPESKNDTIVLRIEPPTARKEKGLESLAKKLIGKRVHVGWPFLIESVVVCISDSTFSYTKKGFDNQTAIRYSDVDLKPHELERTQNIIDKWDNRSVRLEDSYSRQYAVLIGLVEVLVEVCMLKGMKRLDNGDLVKDFGVYADRKEYPYQIVVREVSMEDPRYVEKPAPPIEEEFAIGKHGFYLGLDGPFYGMKFTVTGFSPSGRSLIMSTSIKDIEPPKFGQEILKNWGDAKEYYPGWKVAKALGVSPLAISKISSSAFVVPVDGSGKALPGEKHNIGISIKYDAKQLKVVGYTKYSRQNGWEFSPLAVKLLEEYYEQFPGVFDAFGESKADFPLVSDIFEPVDVVKEFTRLKDWLKAKNIKSFDQVPVDIEVLPGSLVKELEVGVEKWLKARNSATEKESEITGVPAQLVLLPEQAQYRLQKTQIFKICDRVVCVPNVGSVPMGSLGTVVGVEKPELNQRQKLQEQTTIEKKHTWIHVLFDEPFLGGSDLGGICSDQRGSVVSSQVLLNLTTPQPPLHRRFVAHEQLKVQLDEAASKLPAASGKKKKSKKAQDDHGLIKSASASTAPGVFKQNVWDSRAKQRDLLGVLKKAEPAKALSPLSQPFSAEAATNQLKFLLNIGGARSDSPSAEKVAMKPLSVQSSEFKPVKVAAAVATVKDDSSKHLLAMLGKRAPADNGKAKKDVDLVLNSELQWVPASSVSTRKTRKNKK